MQDELQIPPTIRPKLATMEPSVKAAMLKSSHTLALKAPNSPPKGFRKSHSSESLSSPRARPIDYDDDIFQHPGIPPLQLAGTSKSKPFSTAGHARGVSMSLEKSAFASQSAVSLLSTKDFSKDKKESKTAAQAARWCTILNSTSTLQLDVETVKKLRLLLRNEAARLVYPIPRVPVY